MSVLKRLRAEAIHVKTMYVEDDEGIRLQITSFLEKFFTDFVVFADGQAAYEWFQNNPVDLVVTDIRMPKMDGLSLSKKIKESHPQTEIIIVSAHSDQELLLEAINADVDNYILKPVDNSLFANALIKSVRTIKLTQRSDRLNRKIQNILNFQDNLIFVFDGERITTCNRAFLLFMGAKNLKSLYERGFDFSSLFKREPGYFYFQENNAFCPADISSMKVIICDRKNQTEKTFLLKSSPLPDEENTCIFSLSDISDIEAQFRNLEQQVSRDPLSGLYNRSKFHQLLDSETLRAKRFNLPLSLALITIDGFETLQQSFDQYRLDHIIQEICSYIESKFGDSEIIGRLESMEIGILMPNQEITGAHQKLDELRRDIESHKFLDIYITCSIGLSSLQLLSDSDLLIRNADKMLHQARELGGNRIYSEISHKPGFVLFQKEQQAALQLFEVIQLKNQKIHVTLFYRGMSLSSNVEIKKILKDPPKLAFDLSTKQIRATKFTKEIYLEHDFFPKPIKARIVHSNVNSGSLAVDTFTFTTSSPTQREVLRLQMHAESNARITYKGNSIQCQIDDLSTKSIALHGENKGGLHLDGEVKVMFTLDDLYFALDGKVIKIQETERGYRFVIMLSHLNHSEKTLTKILSELQVRLVRELHEKLV